MVVTEKAYAKINLTLSVVGKRPDGYHELCTIFQSLRLADTLHFSERQDGCISVACNIPTVPTDQQNLVWQAASLLRTHYQIKKGVHIDLDKHIPVAAGLAGGSSNAAATLRGLVRLWGLPSEHLLSMAAQLGADVPFCLAGGTMLGTGRGEKLIPLAPCPLFYVVLANPGFPVSTAEVFGAYRLEADYLAPDTAGLIQAIGLKDRGGITSRLANVLESATFKLYPPVLHLKEQMCQFGPSLMCGSGATVYTLFHDKEAAENLCSFLRQSGVDAWLTQTQSGYFTEVQSGV